VNRAGEAGTLYQIGALAWQKGRKEIAIRLVAICLSIEQSIGHGGVKETLQGLRQMIRY